jgi:quercetin dioxygenase-like cupin family protein
VKEATSMSKSSGEPFVLLPGEGREIDLGTSSMFVKAAGEETQGAFTLLESSAPAGFGPPLHIHRDAAESFYVLQGEYTMVVDGNEYVCPAGSFIYIPAGLPHTFRVGAMASRKLNLYTPAAMVGYFDDLSRATGGGPVAPELLSEIARAHSMEVLGPVPERYA